MEGLLVAIIGSMQAVVVAVIVGFFARDGRKRKLMLEEEERRLALRSEENLLSMHLMSASINLGIVTAQAIMDGKPNGAMASALEDARKADKAYHAFTKEIAARQTAKS